VSLSTAACGETTQTAEQAREQAPGFVTSGDCPEERSVVRRALDRSRLRVDMDGDGQLDKVAVASRPEAQEPCRGFVGVRLEGGSTYSTHLFARAVPLEGLPARIVGLIRLENQPGAQIVVDTRAAVDALLAQMFTLADGRLRAVEVPGFADGTFIVEGGGVIYPHGAACTADGQMVVTEAAQTRDGRRFEVTRRTYDIPGVPLRLSDPAVERETVPVAELVARFPELDDPHWRACAAPVSRS
jgi:hypothetical protein